MTGFDYSSTARRPAHEDLPRDVRDVIAGYLGGPPDHVQPAGGGFTPGFAATVRRGGAALFVKAASRSGSFVYPAYLRESAVLAALPDGLPIPRLVSSQAVTDSASGDEWVLLCLEHIDGIMPGSPWTMDQAAAVHASLIGLDQRLQMLPAHLVTGSVSDGLTDDGAVMAIFGRCAAGEQSVPFLPALGREHWLDLQGLVERAPFLLEASRIVHNDLRPDNVIIEQPSGRALICDWNFVTRGPAWADWAGLLPYLRHGGLDADALLRSSPLSGGAGADSIDAWLALLAAYMVVSGLSPEVASSPKLRAHGRFTAGIMIDWLSERRKWAA